MRFFRGSHPPAPLKGLKKACTIGLKRDRGSQCPSAFCMFATVFSVLGRAPITRLCTDYPLLSLTRASGLSLWKMAQVLCVYRCDVRIRGAALDHSAFVRVLYTKVSKWLEMPSLSISHEAMHLFLRGV